MPVQLDIPSTHSLKTVQTMPPSHPPNIATKDINSLIATATALITSLPPFTAHTVAAAALTTTGATLTGINVYHFTGGPCAELVPLGNAAGAELALMVAVRNEGRGVLNPCGRCRQVLVELCPEVRVVVRGGDGWVEVVGVRDLLPWLYR